MTTPKRDTTIGLQTADIRIQGTTPYTTEYGDVYYSAENGPAESRHVFIEGNNLPQRFANWHTAQPFVIGETGFGTGLNMLMAWQVFRTCAPSHARLHLVSIEATPLNTEDLSTLWAHPSGLHTYAQRLIECWPTRMRGNHRLQLDKRVTLDLILDAVIPGLTTFDGKAQAWFLDGFAPDRNPEMWHQSVFDQVALKSDPDATFATYTCARAVRDRAAAAGFEWHKRPGPRRKREVLHGHLNPATANTKTIPSSRQRKPWFIAPTSAKPASIAVIGAGIAGATVVEALSRRGHTCDVYDPCGGPGGASGNSQAALHVRPAVENDSRTRFYLNALTYTLRWLADFNPERHWWSDCGLLQLACNDKEAKRQKQCSENLAPPASLFQSVDSYTAAELAGIPLASSTQYGLYFPHAGWVSPIALCEQLLNNSRASMKPKAVQTLQHNGNTWDVACANGETSAYTHVVLACAQAATQLCPDLPPMDAIRGQTTTFPLLDSAKEPDCVVCGEGYVMPAYQQQLHVGASFTRHTKDNVPSASDDQTNREGIAAFAPTLANQLKEPTGSRVAFRSTSYDRMPFVGPVPDSQTWRRDYAPLSQDARQVLDRPGTYRPNLWASLAHGSNGMVSAPLAAEIIVSQMLDEPMPLPIDIIDALHPGRWLIRELIRSR